MFLCTVQVLIISVVAIQAEAQGQLAITAANVIDVEDGTVQMDQTVLIQGRTIIAVGLSENLDLPSGARLLDAAGGYVIPGLWDMHVHMFNNNADQPPNTWTFPLYLAHGVTGVRDMWVRPGEPAAQVHEWRQALENGAFVGPRFGEIGTLVDGASPSHRSTVVTNDEEARAFVERLVESDIDFVKVYTSLTRENFNSLVQAADNAGLHFAGHVPNDVLSSEAAAAGQKSIEHLSGVFYECSSNGEELRTRDASLFSKAAELAETYDPELCATLLDGFAANQTWHVPTFTALRPWAALDVQSLNSDASLAYIPLGEAREWLGLHDFLTYGPPPMKQGLAELYQLQMQIVSDMHEAGIPMLAGTDFGNPYVIPGQTLHDELQAFVDAGLSPLSALQTATLNPARFMERTDEFGAVAPGKVADLIVLRGNPLVDIGHVSDVEAVVLNGRLFERQSLEEMKQKAISDNYLEAVRVPPALAIQAADSTELARFVGRFGSDSGSEIEIAMDGGGLVVDAGDWETYAQPLGGTLFREYGSGTMFVFQVDREGNVEGLDVNDGREVTTFSALE